MYQYKDRFFKKHLTEWKAKYGIPVFNHLFYLCDRSRLPLLQLDDFPVVVFKEADIKPNRKTKNNISANDSHIIIEFDDEKLPIIVQPCIRTIEENISELLWVEEVYFRNEVKEKILIPR